MSTTDSFDKLYKGLHPNHETVTIRKRGYFSKEIQPNINSICIVGGGTAGYLTAFALKKAFPDLSITLVESDKIPVIGVGEATTDDLPKFLHGGLGFDIVDFYQKVQPTWKLGIRFEWGEKNNCFDLPFGWARRDIGLLNSLHHTGNINSMNLPTVLMGKHLSPLFRKGKRSGDYVFGKTNYAYHIDNKLLLAYFQSHTSLSGIKRVSATIQDVKFKNSDEVKYLKTEDGTKIQADFFIDCSGFGSFLLKGKMEAKAKSYQSSLFNNKALTFNLPHNDKIKPFTTSTTMNAGWCWNIPLIDSDHCGYVYSSNFISDDQAWDEVKTRYPDATDPLSVGFTSSRCDRAWIGNVFAVGLSYGFIEPLESTGILLLQKHIVTLLEILRANKWSSSYRKCVNDSIATSWDSLRWFLSVHFKFNKKLNTEYWKAVRSDTDTSGMQPLLDLYHAGAPLSCRHPEV